MIAHRDDQNITHSYWRASVGHKEPYDSLSGSLDAEITIIGGGFTGLNAALQMAIKGHDVALLEAREIGWGASGRNGGQVNPALPVATPEALYQAYQPPFADRLAKLSLASADYLFDLIKTHNISCDSRQTGWIRVHHNQKAKENATLSAQKWADYGADMSMLDADRTAELTGSQNYKSAILTPKGGLVHPLKLAKGLAEVAAAKGARLYENSPLLQLEPHGTSWRIHTKNGTLTTKMVIFASNAYTAFFPQQGSRHQLKLSKTILPLCPIQIATEPLDDALANSILPEGHSLSDSRRMIMYARREADNRIIYGSIGKRARNGKLTGFDWLRNDAYQVFPQLRGTRFPYQWGGQIAITDNRLPRLLKLGDGVIAGLGYNGRGVAMAHIMGQILADYATGTKAEDLPMPLLPPTPYKGRFIQKTGLNSYLRFAKAMDWLESKRHA